jgi:hypothetical protein
VVFPASSVEEDQESTERAMDEEIFEEIQSKKQKRAFEAK